MQIISLNMHDTKMAQAKINSTEKIGLGTTKKLLVPKFIELLWEYPCLLVHEPDHNLVPPVGAKSTNVFLKGIYP